MGPKATLSRAKQQGEQTSSQPRTIGQTRGFADVDEAIGRFGEHFNHLENRFNRFEQTVKPYREYEEKAKNAVHTLQKYESKLASIKDDKIAAKLDQMIDIHQKLFDVMNERPQSLDQHTSNGPPRETGLDRVTTTELASILIARLEKGDPLRRSQWESLHLFRLVDLERGNKRKRQHDPSASHLPPPSVPITPFTDDQQSEEGRSVPAQAPAKRTRGERPMPTDTLKTRKNATTSSRALRANRTEPPVERASDRSRVKNRADRQSTTRRTSRSMTVKEPSPIEEPDEVEDVPRRSGRERRPASRVRNS